MILLRKKENKSNLYSGELTDEIDSFLFCNLFHTYLKKENNILYIMNPIFLKVGKINLGVDDSILYISFSKYNFFKKDIYSILKKYIGMKVEFN